jgi:riboflavin kinase / FMN adenylyltransferase
MDYVTTLTANEPIAITIGNFDGVHSGHQRLMQELRVMAQRLNAKPVLVTFNPHTLLVVRPDIDLQCLTTLEEKLALAGKYGHIPDNIVISFTTEVAQLSANDFLESLRERFILRGMVVGSDFSLGHNRMGDITFLQRYGQEHHIEVLPIQLEATEHTRISSTRIRTLVSEGHISEANALLGHPVVASGIVVKGDQRGKLLGFPTANLLPEPHKLLPANGVYAARARIGNMLQRDGRHDNPVYNSVVNIGVRPTFGGQKRLVEAHLLDVDLDLYDQRITIDFIARLRDEQRFAGIDALKAQIASDARQARQILQKEA